MNRKRVFGAWGLFCVAVLMTAAGCKTAAMKQLEAELAHLQAENERLREELAALLQGDEPSRIDEFTVGLAASERNFDERAFVSLLESSLKTAGGDTPRYKVAPESDERQITKVRGMLIQQYLGAKKVPVRLFNLSYRIQNEGDSFRIGGALVPDSEVTRTTTGDAIRCTLKGPLNAELDRTGKNRYAISYQDTTGRSGAIDITIDDADVVIESSLPKSARQGDIAFNWELSLEKLLVYQVNDFEGDVGVFLRAMRYPAERSLNQYQTIRDSVFLFGYGPYVTGLVNRLETPSYISRVEVLPVSQAVFDRLEGGMSRADLESALREGSGQWQQCNFVEFTRDTKLWERPIAVGFPFVSRQTSEERELMFFTKYSREGSRLVGDYRLGID